MNKDLTSFGNKVCPKNCTADCNDCETVANIFRDAKKNKKALEIIKKFGLEIHITELNAFVTSKTIKGIFNAYIYITDKKDEIELLKSLKEVLKDE